MRGLQIRAFQLFNALSDAEVAEILSSGSIRRLAKNETVFKQGDPAQTFYVLAYGQLKVTRFSPEGHQMLIHFVVPGELFGIATAIGRRDYPGTATAVTESMVLAWDSSLWQDMTVRYPAFTANAIAALGQRFFDAHLRLQEMTSAEVEQRIARAVLRLINQAGRRIPGGILVDFPIKRQDIAEMAGTTLHTVSRILRTWERAGWVEGGRERLLVRDPERLRLLADGRSQER